MSAAAPFEVFISYCRRDEEAAFLLRTELEKCDTTCFLDQTAIKTGDEWLDHIQSAINGARYFALIYSEDANQSTYVKQEVECAAVVSRRGWILLDKSQPREEINKLVGRINACIAYKGDRDTAIRKFAVSIAKSLWKPAVLRLGPAKLCHEKSPYRPYRSYEKSDTLFGRELEIKEITASIYEAFDADSAPALGEKRRLMFVYGPSGTGKSSLMASGVIPRLAREEKVYTVGPLQLRAMKKDFEGYAAEATGRPCVIAIDQFEEIWPEYEQDLPAYTQKMVSNITTTLNQFPDDLAIVLSFREEYLAKVENQFRALEKYWCRHPVRPLSKGDADDCIRGPAAELGIFYEDRLATALVKALSKTASYRGPSGEEIVYVEPVELQIVCERLWNEVEEGTQDIHSADLLKACNKIKPETKGRLVDEVDQLARIFFEHVTKGFLDGAVADISVTPAAIASNYNTPERIYFALRQFVSDTKKRISLKTDEEGGQKWVGRLPISIVHEMSERHLLRKPVDIPGKERFELVHDGLAERIIEKKEQMDLFYAANSLSSEMTKIKQKRAGGFHGWFEDYESTVKDMTEFKKFQGLNSEEAEFIFRSALAYGKDKQKELNEWTETIGRQHFSVLTKVLHDALSPKPLSGAVSPALALTASSPDRPIGWVRINAAALLRKKEIQEKLDKLEPGKLLALLKDLKNVVCGEPAPDDAELEELCYTLATCREPVDKCGHLQGVLPGKGELTAMRTRILLWMRDKANMDDGGCFARGWKTLSAGRRASLTVQLYWLRLRKAFLRMAFIVFISTMTTALGAALMFAPWGHFGSSFTQSSSVSGVGQGLFHGVFGGIIWGSFLSLATLVYWLILRGRRIEKKFSHWLGGVALSALAGLLGGIALSIMVLNVDAITTMKAAGWLTQLDDQKKLADAFYETGGGWILPIYGLFLGVGVGWSMLDLYHDSSFRTFVANQKPLTAGGQFLKWLLEILWRVVLKSAPTALGMALAAVLLCFLFSRHTLDCKPYQWGRPARCNDIQMYGPPDPPDNGMKLTPEQLERQRIAPLEWRATGMAAIIFAGAYSMMVGYLLALLTIRFGVEVPEDKRFLVANDLSATNVPVGTVDASEAS
jgi:TIR domain